ncbi:hypothetical protein POVCU2_0020330 [Plasmodium ovale curtisi]|nr:hypothetical protein POVCU2_0020330 [Plasmodium ovale curtisi]
MEKESLCKLSLGMFSSLQHVYGKGKGVGYIVTKGVSTSVCICSRKGGGVKKGTFVNRKDTFINRKHSAGAYGKEEKKLHTPAGGVHLFVYLGIAVLLITIN